MYIKMPIFLQDLEFNFVCELELNLYQSHNFLYGNLLHLLIS
jgi:hypothetical protein